LKKEEEGKERGEQGFSLTYKGRREIEYKCYQERLTPPEAARARCRRYSRYMAEKGLPPFVLPLTRVRVRVLLLSFSPFP
jgi:hypothetical protein